MSSTEPTTPAPVTPKKRFWIGEILCIATKLVLIPATSRKEAEEILQGSRDGVEGIDVRYGSERSAKVIREDKPSTWKP